MRNTKISKFSNVRDRKVETVNLRAWLEDDSHKDFVLRIRSIDDKEEIKKLKSMLPCVTMSGMFSERKLSGLLKHSGFICIDIDAKENPHITDFPKLRDELRNIQNISYSSLSVSGNGVFCLIPIKFPEKHKEHFKALQQCFEKLGIIIDKACSDITRLRIYSYDPDAYFNEEAIIFNEIFTLSKSTMKPKEFIKKEFKVSQKTSSTENRSTYVRVLNIIKKLNSKEIDITDNYGEWFQIASALANEFSEEGRELFHMVSQNSIKYKEGETDALFSNCIEISYGFKIGTFFHLAERASKN